MKTLVIIPTFLEAENIADVLGQVRAVAPQVDILVVDDSSPDGTADLARAAAEELGRIDVLSRPSKGGLGGAYAGFQRASPRATRSSCRWTPTCPTRPTGSRPCSPRSTTGPTSPSAPLHRGRRHRQLAAGADRAVPGRQLLRLERARPRCAGRHRRVPGLPGRHPGDGRGQCHQGDGLRVPAGAVVPGAPARRPPWSRCRSPSATGSAACPRCPGGSSARPCRW